jgi:hypothetical protein
MPISVLFLVVALIIFAIGVVALRIAEGQSLSQLISAWAPASDGNATGAYIANVAAWASIPDVDQPLWNFILS